MKIGITGASGLLGRTFTHTLSHEGRGKFVLSFTGYPGRIENKQDLNVWIKKEQPQAILHFAAVVPVQKCQSDPALAFQTNVQGTVHLLEAVHQSCPEAWVFIPSSSHVYSSSSKSITENSKIGPAGFYGFTKLMQEESAVYLGKLWNLKICVGRIFSYAGPGQNESYLLPSVIKRIKEAPHGTELEFRGGGNVRDFLNIREVAVCIKKLLDKKAVGIFNICSGQAVTINQIVCQTAEILQRTDLHLTIHKDSQPSRLVGSNQKLIKTIRYKPKTDLRALIPEMVK